MECADYHHGYPVRDSKQYKSILELKK